MYKRERERERERKVDVVGAADVAAVSGAVANVVRATNAAKVADVLRFMCVVGGGGFGMREVLLLLLLLL